MPPGPSTTRRDILSAYLASFTKIGSWAAVSAMTYRWLGPTPFAILALVRSTVGLLNYVSFGMGPAMVHYLARTIRQDAIAVAPAEAPQAGLSVLSYYPPEAPGAGPRIYASGLAATGVLVSLGLLGLMVCWPDAPKWLGLPQLYAQETRDLMLGIGLGVLARILSDPAGAVLQSHGRIALDNLLLALADIAWVLLLVAMMSLFAWRLKWAGISFAVANALLVVARNVVAERILPTPLQRRSVEWRLVTKLMTFGALVTAAQLADFLYAPVDYILISRLLGTNDLAAYAPCVQIDAALLVLVTGLSTVLLPKAALAHARNDTATLRRYYLTGTLISALLLLAAALATWLAAPLLLRLWLHDIPPGTLAILPLVLLHTVIGGSSAVGRSILLGAGRVRPFTLMVLITGVTNVAISYALVRHTNLGLKGIVLGTIIAVTLRCALWMPWYTLRTLRHHPTPPEPTNSKS